MTQVDAELLPCAKGTRNIWSTLDVRHCFDEAKTQRSESSLHFRDARCASVGDAASCRLHCLKGACGCEFQSGSRTRPVLERAPVPTSSLVQQESNLSAGGQLISLIEQSMAAVSVEDCGSTLTSGSTRRRDHDFINISSSDTVGTTQLGERREGSRAPTQTSHTDMTPESYEVGEESRRPDENPSAQETGGHSESLFIDSQYLWQLKRLLSSCDELDTSYDSSKVTDEPRKPRELPEPPTSDAPSEHPVSSIPFSSDSGLLNLLVMSTPRMQRYLANLVKAFRAVSRGHIPSSSCLQEVAELLSLEQLMRLARRYPILGELLAADGAGEAGLEKERLSRRLRERLAREALLDQMGDAEGVSTLSQVLDVSGNAVERARLELRASKLAPFQRFVREKIAGRQPRTPTISQQHGESARGDSSARDEIRAAAQRCAHELERERKLLGCQRALKVKIDRLLAPLPFHARTLRRQWRRLKEQSRGVAVEALRTVDAINARRELIRERERKQRMKLLKENDFEKYMELVRRSKNTRIEELLKQTDLFLTSVAGRVRLQQHVTAVARTKQRRKSQGSTEDEGGGTAVEEPRGGEESGGIGQALSDFMRTAVPVEKQPRSLVGGDLLPYQMAGLQFLVHLHNCNLSGILADEMGLGKTIQTIALLAYLKEELGIEGPHLIVVPLSTLPNWASELQRWCPSLTVLQYRGNREERKLLARTVRRAQFNICLTTYDWIIREKATLAHPYWGFVIVDEGHRMKNAKSKFHETLSGFSSTHRLLLTGTPLQNNLSELWSLLNFLLPEIFTSAADFEAWFEEPFRTAGGGGDAASGGTSSEMLTEEEKFLIINRLHEVLRPFLLRRVKAEVLGDLPEKREYIVRVQLSSWQKAAYEKLSTKAFKKEVTLRSYSNVMMQLRKVVNHPFLFENEYYINEGLIRASGKFEVLDRMLPKLIAFKHKTLIFCQMTQLMDILDDYLELRGIKRCRLDGTTLLEDRKQRMSDFNDPNSDLFVFVLSTRAGGLGLNLQAADTVIIFDSDWNPHQDLQAQARAHRMGQTNEVRVFRLVTVSNIEEAVLRKAQHKLSIDEKIIQAGMFNEKTTEEERQERLRALLYTKDMTSAARVTTPQELNRFLARTEEEEQAFQAADRKLFGPLLFRSFQEIGGAVAAYSQNAADREKDLANLEVDADATPTQATSRKRSRSTRNSVAARKKARRARNEEAERKTLGEQLELLLIKGERLMSEDQVPETWLMNDDATNPSAASTEMLLDRSARRIKSSAEPLRLSIEAESLSEAAFARALQHLESGKASDFESALALERSRRTPIRQSSRNSPLMEADTVEEPPKKKSRVSGGLDTPEVSPKTSKSKGGDKRKKAAK